MKRKKRIGTVGKAIGCVILLFVALFPIYWLVAMAIRPTSEMTGHISIIPHALTGSTLSSCSAKRVSAPPLSTVCKRPSARWRSP